MPRDNPRLLCVPISLVRIVGLALDIVLLAFALEAHRQGNGNVVTYIAVILCPHSEYLQLTQAVCLLLFDEHIRPRQLLVISDRVQSIGGGYVRLRLAHVGCDDRRRSHLASAFLHLRNLV